MRIQIVHLSDIHFRRAGNPLFDVTDELASAVASVDSLASLLIVVLSGDTAYHGLITEYAVARDFLKRFDKKLRELRPGTNVQYVSVPGNHDCVLPEEQVKLREALIQGVLPSMQDTKQDKALLAQVLKAQAPYAKFRKQAGGTRTWDGICETVYINEGSKKIQLNLYNTAIFRSAMSSRVSYTSP